MWTKEAKDDKEDTTERDRCERKGNERLTLVIGMCGDRSNVRSAMRAANQLPGGEPTGVDGAPAPASYI